MMLMSVGLMGAYSRRPYAGDIALSGVFRFGPPPPAYGQPHLDGGGVRFRADSVVSETYVIVGAGLAGAKAAETLRAEGFDGRVVLLGSEPDRPYERPPLSKDYLRGETEREGPYVHPAGFYEEQGIELRTETTVTALDLAAGEVVVGEERLGFGRLLLATGAEPRRLPVPGADLDGVHYLRDFGDSDALRERIEGSGRVAVVGAGWIGAEVAASARQKGLEVTLIEQLDVPLERVLGREVGEIYAAIHRDQGVELLTGTAVEAIEGSGRAERVRLAGGRTVDCDFVVVGIGVAPRTAPAEAAGLEVGDGIHVDERLRTSAPGVFAAGDVAAARHPLFATRLRVEHWHNALEQGPAAARGMLGKGDPYDTIPYFFSDQYDVGMEYAGYATEWAEVVFRGDVDAREFIAFWLKDGRVLAGMNVNVWDVTDDIQALIRNRTEVDRGRLQDLDTPLA
jgi:3-phenylpropionate/trans-cinnamate dioxygenase ferredoxin reductase component